MVIVNKLIRPHLMASGMLIEMRFSRESYRNIHRSNGDDASNFVLVISQPDVSEFMVYTYFVVILYCIE